MERELLLQIEVPDVLFSDSLEQIGAPVATDAAEMYSGVGVSAGITTGKARVLLTPARRASIRPRLYSGMSINRSRMDTTFSPRSGSGNGARRYSVTRRSCRERVWCSRCR